MKAKAMVLGGTGMLGSAITRRLEDLDINLTATTRDITRAPISKTPFVQFSTNGNLHALLESFGNGDLVVNCVGLIKQRMSDYEKDDRLAAIRVNAEFPYVLAELAEKQGFRVLQIATDCVFAGSAGSYNELSPHDALDVYGKTKSLGEVPSSHVLHLRCSIIGRELTGNASLVEWLLSQQPGSTIQGYSDHFWNGVTTAGFADIAAGLITAPGNLAGVFHVVPADVLDKNQLSQLILQVFGRKDVKVSPTVTGDHIDRTLSTLHPQTNQLLWRQAGYSQPPTIKQMIQSLAK